MLFQQNVSKTSNINPDHIKNSDVFFNYYQNIIKMMIKERDTSILKNTNILKFWHHSKAVPELWKTILD